MVVDTARDRVVNEIGLVGAVSSDPAPDLLEVSPMGNRVFATLRGPSPLTANVPGGEQRHRSTPGVGVVRVQRAGRGGVLQAIAPISRIGRCRARGPTWAGVRLK